MITKSIPSHLTPPTPTANTASTNEVNNYFHDFKLLTSVSQSVATAEGTVQHVVSGKVDTPYSSFQRI